jgi:hypothetical protein
MTCLFNQERSLTGREGEKEVGKVAKTNPPSLLLSLFPFFRKGG